jgi:hypothetical protein
MRTPSTAIRGMLVSFIILGIVCLSIFGFFQSGKGEQSSAVNWKLENLILEDPTPAPTSIPLMPMYFPVIKNNFGVLYSNVIVASGQGFDLCKPLSVEGMQTWWDSSPYSTVNVYLGGISALCPFDQLDLNWYSQVAQQGWSFILTWAGPQAPKGCPEACKFRYPMSLDPDIAYLEGKIEAFAAVDAAVGLGFKGQLIIYYDVESYSGADAESRAAVAAFLRGWVEQLHALGHKAGAYGAACTSYIVDWAFNIPPPDNVWIAQWSKNFAYDPDASVWNTTCLDDDNGPPIFWTDHQRLKQYTGPHDEVWGGLLAKIDSNVLDGQVITLSGQPPAQDSHTEITAEPSREIILLSGPQVQAMQPLSSKEGWVLNGDQLFWTGDRGASWEDISPNINEDGQILGVTFLDNRQGWLVSQQDSAGKIGSLSISQTDNGGLTWQKVSILIDNPEEIIEIESAALDFIDSQTGWISFKLHSSSNFSFGRLLVTEDGGHTWQERTLPLGEPVLFLDAEHGWISGGPLDQTYFTEDGGESWSLLETPKVDQSVGLKPRPDSPLGIENQLFDGELPKGAVVLDMLDKQFGWVIVQDGFCAGEKLRAGEIISPASQPLECETSSQLLMTSDGGITWRGISPP